MMGRLFMVIALVLSLGLFTTGCKKDEPALPNVNEMNNAMENAAADAEEAAADAEAAAANAAEEATDALEGLGSN